MLILGILKESIIALGITILAGVYHVAAWSFELFLVLACGRLLTTDKYQILIENFYIVTGIIMLFFLAFILLKGMVDPDNKKGGTSTVKKVIVNIVLSTLILAVLPTVFTFLYDFQNSVIMNQNTIGKFFGYGSTEESDDFDNPTKNLAKVRTGAYQIVNAVYTAFLNVEPSECNPPIDDNNTTAELVENCQANTYAKKWSVAKGVIVDKCEQNKLSFTCATGIADKYGKFMIYANFADNIDEGEMNFNFLVGLIAGCILAYVGISFAIDMALRLVKLAFYQLIAPIPIFSMIIPDTKLSKSFNTWLKVVLTCYMEVFVRIFVMYFAVFLCAKMLEKPSFLTEAVYSYGGSFIAFLARAFAVMGVILFMKQAPKLLSEVTGLDSGNMKLGLRDKLKDAGVFTAGAAIGAGVTASVRKGADQIPNIKNKFNAIKGTKGKAKAKAILGAAGSVVGGAGKVIAAKKSAVVRATKEGWKAGSFKDAKAAASKGAKDSIDAGIKRTAYRAAHSRGKGYWDDKAQVILGHGKDAWTSVSSWAGVKNVQEMKDENYAMQTITSKKDSYQSKLEAYVEKELSKSAASIDLEGVTIDLSNIYKLETALHTASLDPNGQATYTDSFGNSQTYTQKQLQAMIDVEKKNAAYQLQDIVSVDLETFRHYSQKGQSKMAELKVADEELRGVIRNNSHLDVSKQAGILGDNYADDKTLALNRVINEYYDTGTNSWMEITPGVVVPANAQTRNRYDDSIQIDTLSKAIKKKTGENNIEIVAREHQKPEDDKKK